jgi:hypothetical protein
MKSSAGSGYTPDDILAVLDRCCDDFTFPMLDNGYVYLAATRLSAYRSHADWAIAIEVFGFSPRAGLPDVHVYTFGSRLVREKGPGDYVSREAFDNYLAANPHNESRFFYPISEGPWLDPETDELVAEDASVIELRDQRLDVPPPSELATLGIELQEPPRIATFELCRYLAGAHRDAVLATPAERRASVPPEVPDFLVLDEWNHPNVVEDTERPSGSPTFQQLAHALVTGDASSFKPTLAPNTHWSHWPEGGTL